MGRSLYSLLMVMLRWLAMASLCKETADYFSVTNMLIPSLLIVSGKLLWLINTSATQWTSAMLVVSAVLLLILWTCLVILIMDVLRGISIAMPKSSTISGVPSLTP